MTLNNKLFRDLLESMKQMGEILRGERKPSREFNVDAEMVKKLRAASHVARPRRS